MDLSRSVHARLAALGLDDKGRLTPQLMASAAVRCGLLVDLALDERLLLTEDSIELDARPTGVPAADRLLLAMAAEPDRSLDSWFAESRLGLAQVAESLVEAGSWSCRRALLGLRYSVDDPQQRAADLGRDLGEPAPDAPTAAVAALGAMANMIGSTRRRELYQAPAEVPAALSGAIGEHAWVLSAALDHLRSTRADLATGASALRAGMVSNPGPG